MDNLSTRYIRVLTEPAIDEAEACPICQIQVYNLESVKAHMIEHLGLYGGKPQAVKASKESFHLYLFIGQSNMSSRASIESADMVAINRAYVFNGRHEWEKAENGLVDNLPQITMIQGLNRYASVEVSTKINGYSMASTFAQVITDHVPGIEVGIISNARGGTGLAEWQKGAGTGLYEEAVRRTREAMKSGTIKGILWHQGERDQNEPESYLSNLYRLITDLRNDFQAPQLPCIIGQLLHTKNAIFNQTLTTVTEFIPYSNWVSNEGTASIGDGTHMDNASQKLLGQRYAERILEHYSNELAANGKGNASL